MPVEKSHMNSGAVVLPRSVSTTPAAYVNKAIVGVCHVQEDAIHVRSPASGANFGPWETHP